MSGNAYAANRTWTGAGGDNNWSTPGNWDGGATKPAAGDNILFPGATVPAPQGNKDCTINEDISVGWFDTDGYQGIITQSGGNVATNGDLSFKQGTWIATNNRTLNVTTGSINLGWPDSGAVSMDLSAGGTVSVTWDIIFYEDADDSATLTLGNQSFSCSNMDIDGTNVNSTGGTLNAGGATINVSRNWRSSRNTATFICGNSTVNATVPDPVDVGFKVKGTQDNNLNDFNFTGDGKLWMESDWLVNGDFSCTNAGGTFRQDGGVGAPWTLTVGGNFSNASNWVKGGDSPNIVLNGGGAQNLTSGGKDLGNIQLSTAGTNVSLQDALNGDNLTIDAGTTLDTTAAGDWNITLTNDITINGTLTANGSTIRVKRNWRSDGVNAVFNCGTSTVISTVTDADSCGITTKDTNPFWNFEKTGTSGAFGKCFMETDWIVNNDFTVTNGEFYQTGNFGQWDLTVKGDFSVAAAVALWDKSTDDPCIILNGGGAQNLTSGGKDLGNIQLSTAGTNVDLQDALTCGNLTIDANTILTDTVDNANLTLGGSVANAGTITFNAPTSDLIQIRSTVDATQRNWQGAGAFNMTDVDVKDQTCIGGTPANIYVVDGTDSGNNVNWAFTATAITVPVDGSNVNRQPTIMGNGTPGDTVTIKGTVGTVPFQTVATTTVDANGNYRVRQVDYTQVLDDGLNDIRPYVGAAGGVVVTVNVSAAPGPALTPTITSPADGSRINGSTPTISGQSGPALAGQAVALWASDLNNVNLLLTNVANTVVDAGGNWTINAGEYTIPLVKGINYLSVVVNNVASNITTVTFTDPFGVVFDSVTDNPISDAVVTIYDSAGAILVPGVAGAGGCQIAAADANPQTTGATGAYSFLCANANGYTIGVSAAGYHFPSTVTNLPEDRVIVNGSRGEAFNVAGVVIQMDFPLDPTDMLLRINKISNKKEAVIGEVVTYTVEIKNPGSSDVTGVYLADQIPGGFKYINGKAVLDNVPINPAGNRPIVFNIGTVGAGRTRVLKYQLVVGSGVTQGVYENSAWAQYSDGVIISNKDNETVRVVLDPLFDLGTIIGKVFWDKNETGYQEAPKNRGPEAPKRTDEEVEAETGIGGVQIVMEDGTVATTDKDGKYHFQAVIPGRHLIRINERTLPDGAYLTTDKVIVVDTTAGLLSKVNFGVNSKDKGLKEQEERKAPVKILQKEEKAKPFLNAGLYPSAVVSYAGYDFEVQSLPFAYEFRIFTNYSLFIKTWKLEILDDDTKALVRGFNGTYLTMNEPIYWDGKDKEGKWLDPDRNYVYVLSVMDRTGRADTTKPEKLTVAKYKREALEPTGSEKKKRRSEWLKKESRANNLDIQNIKLSDKVVVIESKDGFEAKQEVAGPDTDDASRINITVDETTVPVLGSAEGDEGFVQEVIIPEGEHKVTVESTGAEGKKEDRTEYVKDDENYLLFVAMGDGKAGYTFQKGNIEPVQHDDKFRKGFWSEGKLAYYLKGKVLGKYLITSSLDTDREKKALFRNLDPNKYYPVYGDASKINYDATNTQGMLYLLVEWDKSSALWGDYNVDFKDTEFATFKRSLYGANVRYEAVSTTQFGEPTTKVAVFKATAKQQAAHNEFVGTGGSLFYLKNKDVTEGSEKVAIEVRDKVTGLVLATLAQQEGFDYQIDYDNGRIMFWEPVSRIAESSSIVSSALLDGNPIYVTVDYEYETLDKYDEGVYGARAEQSITDYVRLGGTYIKEDQQDKNYGLAGVDATIHLGDKTTITGEFAQSKSQELGRFISTDGGITFTPLLTDQAATGKAYGIKGESRLFDKFGVSGYYKKIDKDFSSISTASQQGKELVGAAITYDITPKTRISARHDRQELLADGNPQTQLQLGARKTETTSAQITHTMDRVKLTGEYRHQKTGEKIEMYKSETNENGDIVAARADYKLTDRTNLFAEQQVTVKGSPNNQTTAGVETKLNEYVSLRGKETVGTRGDATSVGAFANISDKFKVSGDYTLAAYKTGDRENTAAATASAKVDENSEIYNTYATSNSAFEGKKTSHVFGAKKTLNNGLELSMEEQEANSMREVSDTNIFGVSGNVNDRVALAAKFERGIVQDFDGTRYNRNAPSLALSYNDKDKIKASLKAEARFDNADEDKRQYLAYAAIEDKITRDLTLFAKANVSSSDNTTSESNLALYKEFTLGAAYRPVDFDRLNLLARYNYLQNDAPSGQVDINDIEAYKAHVLSGEAAFDLTDHWQIVEKVALRIGEEKVTGFGSTRTNTWLVVNRLNYNVNRDWQVGAEYRRLAQSQAKDAKQGVLVELARNIGQYVQASVGYNFTEFNDDLTSLDYTAHGPFVRLTGKFFDRTPEEIEQLRQKKEEERIKRWVQELLNHELSRPDSEKAQELRRYYRTAEIAQREGRFDTAKRYYAKVIETGNALKLEAEDYVRGRVELEKTLAKEDELARAYYKDGRLQEAKEIWEKVIAAGTAKLGE